MECTIFTAVNGKHQETFDSNQLFTQKPASMVKPQPVEMDKKRLPRKLKWRLNAPKKFIGQVEDTETIEILQD